MGWVGVAGILSSPILRVGWGWSETQLWHRVHSGLIQGTKGMAYLSNWFCQTLKGRSKFDSGFPKLDDGVECFSFYDYF